MVARKKRTAEEQYKLAVQAQIEGDEVVAAREEVHVATVTKWRAKFGLQLHKIPAGATQPSSNKTVAAPVGITDQTPIQNLVEPISNPNEYDGWNQELSGSLARRGKEPTEQQKKMETALKEVFQSGGFKRLQECRQLFHHYSFHNTVQIMLGYLSHDIDPRAVMSKSKWEKLGRTIKEDGIGVPVVVPRNYVVRDENGNPIKRFENKQPVLAQEGESPMTATSFRITKDTLVYDVSQTEGEDIPGITVELTDKKVVGSAEAITAMQKELESAVEAVGVNVVDADLKPGYLGMLCRDGQSIGDLGILLEEDSDDTSPKIILSKDLEPAQRMQILAHELGHYFDRSLIANPESYILHRDDAEAVAEMTAWSLCDDWGIDSTDFSAEYMAGYNPGRVKMAKNVLERWNESVKAIRLAAALGRGENPNLDNAGLSKPVLEQLQAARDKTPQLAPVAA